MWREEWPQPWITPVGFSRRPAPSRAPARATHPDRATLRPAAPVRASDRVRAPSPAPAPTPVHAPRRAPAPTPVHAPTRASAPTPRAAGAEPPNFGPPPDLKRDAARLREALSDLEASKHRLAAEQVREAEAMRCRLVGELLPVLDNLDKTLAAATGAPEEPLARGVELVRSQLEKVLAGYGAERFVSAGEPFDPARHEALAVQPVGDAALDGVVIDEWRAGYQIGAKILRPAQVVVGRLAD